MLFNSYEFLLVFLPVTLTLYFTLNKRSASSAGKVILLSCSWFFYAWWNPIYLPLLLGSTLCNYLIAERIRGCSKNEGQHKRRLMLLGVLFNACLLGYFKYMDFFLTNLNWLGFDIPLLKLALPLAISFFSLQQIAYIVDSYRNIPSSGGLLDYMIFVSFFPQLIAGPIVHHREMIPQLRDGENRAINYSNLSLGSFLFAIGLFKKVILADTFAVWANNGFDHAQVLNIVEAWIVSYGYTLQLYFDFSGYSDMAMGLALMFNIKLPQNFNSPYRATSIINLWQRWHMTLTRFINMYIYKPILRALPRVNFTNGMISSFTAMVIAGVWHGAAWSFVIFGILQGVAIVINHCWRKFGAWEMPDVLGWLLTFHFFSFSLVIFRAVEWQDAIKVYRGMLGLDGQGKMISIAKIYGTEIPWFIQLADRGTEKILWATLSCAIIIGVMIIQVALLPNSNQLADRFQTSPKYILATFFLLIPAIMLLSRPSEFIYFQF
jgi:D-alanyl-lipoteichoic acid acyltransferase DltB (MBOAT superfamily)